MKTPFGEFSSRSRCLFYLIFFPFIAKSVTGCCDSNQRSSWTPWSIPKHKFTQKYNIAIELFPSEIAKLITQILYNDDSLMFKLCTNSEDSHDNETQKIKQKSNRMAEREQTDSGGNKSKKSLFDPEINYFGAMRELEISLQMANGFGVAIDMLMAGLEYVSCLILEYSRNFVMQNPQCTLAELEENLENVQMDYFWWLQFLRYTYIYVCYIEFIYNQKEIYATPINFVLFPHSEQFARILLNLEEASKGKKKQILKKVFKIFKLLEDLILFDRNHYTEFYALLAQRPQFLLIYDRYINCIKVLMSEVTGANYKIEKLRKIISGQLAL
jgi:hypothetical protein